MISPSAPTPPTDKVQQKTPRSGERVYAILCPPTDLKRLQSFREPNQTRFAHTLTDLIELISGETEPVVLLHALALREADFETARMLREMPCRPVVAVLAGRDSIDRAFGTAHRLGLGCVFPDDCLQYPYELNQWIGWLRQGGPGPGLDAHMEEGADLREIAVQNRKDKPTAIGEVLNSIGEVRPDAKFLFELRLILEETINNAIFHAFCDPLGREKYTIENFTRLDAGESVVLQYAADARTIGVCVSDNQGRLQLGTILGKVQRQLSTQGLFDQSGRGLYLVYSLAGRLVFNLKAGELTQVIALFPIAESSWTECTGHRPLLIFDSES